MSARLPALDTVAEIERDTVAGAHLPLGLRALVDRVLGGPATAIGGGEPPWALLTLLACASAGGSPEPAVPLAAAVDLQTAAYRLLDDLEDGHVSCVVWRAGSPVACNLATTLLALAQRALLRAPAPAAEVLTSGWLAACAGQHEDLTLGAEDPGSLDAALRAAKGKTGAIAGAAAEAGALLGGVGSELAVRYRRFGHAVGLAGQLANDLQGLQTGPDGASDLSRGQITLPILFALGSGCPPLQACLQAARIGRSVDRALHRQALAEVSESGAYRYVWLLREEARREAATALAAIARERAVCGTLDRLLPPSGIGAEVSP